MAATVEIIVQFNHFGTLAEAVMHRLDEIVRDTASDIIAHAQGAAPVDTGALRESIYGVTDQWSTYELAAAEARSARPEIEILPEERPQGPHEATVGVAANYGIFQEMGTVNLGARPFLTPAVVSAANKFEREIAQVLNTIP